MQCLVLLEVNMSNYRLSQRSMQNLSGVHPDLVAVVKRAIEITEQDFSVIEGVRNIDRQRKLVAQGKSKTMNSRHLTGHAVDLAPYPLSWDWEYFYPIADAMKQAAEELEVDLEWGGDWSSFPDGPHFQLSWDIYPR
jgi:peptidoglycan L-alanyl-D-glutamate endopeptidase CwlK